MLQAHFCHDDNHITALHLTTRHTTPQVDKDLREMLVRPDAPAAKTVGVRVWPKAIPQFNVAHLDTVQARRPPHPARSTSEGSVPRGACPERLLGRLRPAAGRAAGSSV